MDNGYGFINRVIMGVYSSIIKHQITFIFERVQLGDWEVLKEFT